MISFTARAATYTISSYPAGLAEVSCDAFKKNADGSWTQVDILIAGGALIPAEQFQEHGRDPRYREEVQQGIGIGTRATPAGQISLGNQNALALGGVP